MLKRSLAAGLLACAALTPMALAQGQSGSQTKQSGAQGSVQFLQTLEQRQFRGSDLMGQAVYNQQDENIGDIGDVLLDQGGQIRGVVIDVGGFLGIGANEVAVPFDALKFEPMQDQTASAGQGNDSASGRSAAESGSGAAGSGAADSNTQTGPAAQSAAQGQGGAASGETAGTASQAPLPNQTSGSRAGSDSAANTSASGSGENMSGSGSAGSQSSNQMAANENTATGDSTLQARIVLNVSRDQLENAPKFDDSAARGTQGQAGSGSGNK